MTHHTERSLAETSDLAYGLYERLIDGETQALLEPLGDDVVDQAEVDEANFPFVAAEHVGRRIERALRSVPAAECLPLVNRIMDLVSDTVDSQQIQAPASVLRAVKESGADFLERPLTPLSETALMTNAPSEPSLFSELNKEMLSADRVDLLCAFIKHSGLRLLRPGLENLRRRGVPLRVLTTTYIGATDRQALDELVEDFDAEVKVNYDAASTRLHAKAWLFHRRTGFHTGYVGSSNMSRDAMLDGLEWNVRISQVATENLMRKFDAVFQDYWQRDAFEAYLPGRDGDRLDEALVRASNGGRSPKRSSTVRHFLDVHPYPYQNVMLEQLTAERENFGRTENLVVAATGTGKTVVAALDYQQLLMHWTRGHGARPRLLFLAHRKEILEQARKTYQDVLQDASFGEMLVDGMAPRVGDHVFASVASLNGISGRGRWDPEHFDVLVIDEFHHAAADSYRDILDRFRPRQLLGLTATPERADGVNVAQEFFGGRIASELRLWDALEEDLLVPFHYFGIADGVDLDQVRFSRGEYSIAELSQMYTGNHARVGKILRALRRQVANPLQMRALGYCVSVQHAEFMAEQFNRANIPSKALSGESSVTERSSALAALRQGQIQCIFSVDLFNEGLDIPTVDTVLMLRPTQSATIFLQQLGRGLRRAPGKSVLTVLDFVGHQHQDFRFDIKFRALTGLSRRRLQQDVEQGFPFLPTGSQIVLDQEVQKQVLKSLKRQLTFRTADLIQDVRSHLPYGRSEQEFSLAEFLTESGRPLEDIYRAADLIYNGEKRPAGWTALQQWAWPHGDETELAEEKDLLKRIRAFKHVDDLPRIEAYRRILTAPMSEGLMGDPYVPMMVFSFWPGGHPEGLEGGLQRLRNSPLVVAELIQLLDVCADRIHSIARPLGQRLEATPLRSHSRYSREELLAALGQGTVEKAAPQTIREGVKWIPSARADVLLVTLKKSDQDFSPSTMYRDFAIDADTFHWESQSGTTPDSPTGQRYQHHRQRGSRVVLFVREAKAEEGLTSPYMCLGTVTYGGHQGSRPMEIIWKLDRPMPAELLTHARAVA